MGKKTIKPAAAPATPPPASQPPDGAAPPVAAPAVGAMAAERSRVAQGDRFTFVADLAKGAPQAKGIVNILKAAGPKGMTRTELTAAMKGVITTRQPEGRILSYYQKDLMEAGAITIVQATSAPAAAPAPGIVAAPPATPTPAGAPPTPVAAKSQAPVV